ncbi:MULTISPECIES: LysR substrate-binding domain-containing protein [unclassified Lysobacter]|uniref:LysR substrate-binding domain-containing protein n=1 Tax=unclassified Lysobacter TaxID=2635362 RepID=UPI001BEB1D8E|nr:MULTISPECIES: LysR substrate-binding domain-containing protein [unclassified Lysobacter]MBT2750141.1 LysR family transcriptional regulator [Lysobacter sp. ISL-50]MBT2775287.1 LysR family transcriptional regulator [Lysobacter sp. ISL-54]MBT2782661.1 LysR family transcriptional regulator [Lysobacter sp. ISL-52]
MNRPPLHALLGFATAARTSNLTRAAEQMHLTVSALSHQIRTLEERLGRRLFERGPRGVSLTADGERLLSVVAPHLDALDHALRPYSPRRDDVLTLSLMASMASSWLVPRLGSFVALYPQLELNLFSSAALVDFDREPGIDAAMRGGYGRWPGLVIEHLFDETLVPVASPALVERMGGLPAQDDLHRWPLLGDLSTYWQDWFDRYGGGKRPTRFVAHFDDSETMHRAAVEGLGVALGRLARTRLLIRSGQLVPLSQGRLKIDWGHYLVYPQRSVDHGGLESFRTWLHQQARAYIDQMESDLATREVAVTDDGACGLPDAPAVAKPRRKRR